jgi:outer membrane lipoprotein-sorting protein
MRKLLLCGAAAAFFCSGAAAQDAAEILRKSSEALRSLTNWDVELTTFYDTRLRGAASRSQTSERFVRSGNRFRVEETNGRLTVSDGNASWTYTPGGGEYLKHMSPGIQTPLIWVPYSSWNAKVTGEESVPIGGRQTPCWVIDLPSQPPQPLVLQGHESRGPATLWIDKATYLPVKRTSNQTLQVPGQESREATTTFAITKAAFDQPLPESLFRPDLPAGAVEVKQLGFGGLRSPLMGRTLPVIEGTDLQGNPVSSAAWKDKWLVVRFGEIAPTYEMSFCELLYRAFKGGKVAVLNIVTGRQADARAQLARLGYTLPSMLPPETMTAAAMGFTGKSPLSGTSGIILADSAGKVVYHTNEIFSSGTPDAIVKALMEAGVW